MSDSKETTPGQKIIDGMREAVAHARGEISLPVSVRLPGGRRLEIDTQRDHETGVWIATSHDIPDLVVQGETWSTMMTKLKLAIPASDREERRWKVKL